MGLLDMLGGLGTTPPSYMEGLLGAQATEDLRKRSIGSGLVNALIGYAAMPKNENLGLGRILAGAAQQGLAGARGVYDQAGQDFMMQQKIDEIKRQNAQRSAFENAAKGLYATTPAQPEPVAQSGVSLPQTPNQSPSKINREALRQMILSGDPRASAYLTGIKTLSDIDAQEKKRPDSPFGLVDASKFTQPSIAKFAVTGRYEDLLPVDNEQGFGAGTAGASLNLLTKGSLNTPESKSIRSSPDYALAWREVTKPQIIQSEEMDEQGNVRLVSRQVPAPALPRNILPPIYSQESSDALDTPASLPVSSKPNTTPSRSVPADNTMTTAVPAGVKSSPFARNQAELAKYREQMVSSERLQSSLNDLVDYTKKNPNPALWGVGETGGELASKYEDVLTELRLAAELGVLNKEDLPRLMKQLPNPTDIQTWIRGGGTLDSFYGAARAQNDKLTRNIERLNKYVNPNARKNETPASVSTEQELARQLLEKRKKAQKRSKG